MFSRQHRVGQADEGDFKDIFEIEQMCPTSRAARRPGRRVHRDAPRRPHAPAIRAAFNGFVNGEGGGTAALLYPQVPPPPEPTAGAGNRRSGQRPGSPTTSTGRGVHRVTDGGWSEPVELRLDLAREPVAASADEPEAGRG